MTTSTQSTKPLSTKAQLAAALELIAKLTATQATTTAQASAAVTTVLGASNELGSKRYARPILKLVLVEQDWRSDEEFARGIQLSAHETGKRAFQYAMSQRNEAAALYEGSVALSAMEYVTAVTGKWPADHNGFEFGAKVPGTYFAIY